MKIMHVFSLGILLIALPLVGAATDTSVVVKEVFCPNDADGPTAAIFITIAGITHIGSITISPKNGTRQYMFVSYHGDNNFDYWRSKPKQLKITGLLTNLETVLARAKALSAPQDVLDAIRQFVTSHNSFEKMQAAQEAQIRSLMKKKWQEDDRSRQALGIQIQGKKADEEFSKELDDILEYHRQTYGKY